MNIGFVETNLERNIKRVSPFLGVLLVVAVALMVFMFLRAAMQDLTQAVHTEAPKHISGTVRLTSPQPLHYGESAEFRSTVHGGASESTSYITVACFQEDKLVYQRSAQQGVRFYLSDQYERDLEWDGADASCSATLMYRTVGIAQIDVYILDAVSFNVVAKG
jgi:hypothetical protein